MSAPLAGKFQDHYLVLGVEPTAEPEAIQLAYTRLAQQYHAGNPNTGDKDKFDAVNLAYEILSQPDLRGEFDKLKGIGGENSSPKFTGRPFFDSLGRENGLRAALMCVLYDRRRQKPFTPSLSVRHVENIIASTLEEMTFVLWYLKDRRWIISDDKSSLQITADGVEYLEKHPPSADVVMPYIKRSGLATPEAELDEAAEEAAVPESAEASAEEAEAAAEIDCAADEAELVNATPSVEDPLRRANLNRILSRGSN
jgi:curved DNA-binding protein CbpA